MGVLDDENTYLESSSTAMFIVGMAQGILAGWLDSVTFKPIVEKAWSGLSKAISRDGRVSGICKGFGISPTKEDYNQCATTYSKSSPGLGSVLKAAVYVQKLKQLNEQKLMV